MLVVVVASWERRRRQRRRLIRSVSQHYNKIQKQLKFVLIILVHIWILFLLLLLLYFSRDLDKNNNIENKMWIECERKIVTRIKQNNKLAFCCIFLYFSFVFLSKSLVVLLCLLLHYLHQIVADCNFFLFKKQ